MAFYRHFNLGMGRSHGFGSNTSDFIAHFRLAFAAAPDHSTKGTRSPLDGLSVLVSTRFQVLFHSPPGVLFTFPSQYSSLSVTG